jgi:hypothetical protein
MAHSNAARFPAARLLPQNFSFAAASTVKDGPW